MKRLPLLVGGLLLAASPARAAAPFPYELDSGRETAVAAGGVVLAGTGLLAGRGFRPLTPAELAALDPAGLPALDRGATRRWSPAADRASDVLVWTLAAAPVGLMVGRPGREEGGRLALMYAETMLLSGGATLLLKNTVARPRPYAYNPDPRIPDGMRLAPAARKSFPSGHTAQAFAAMVFFATVHERLDPDADHGWVWAGCLGGAAATGYLRYAAGRHFPTDILAGALIGAAAGWLVPAWHEAGATPGTGPPAVARLAFGFGF